MVKIAICDDEQLIHDDLQKMLVCYSVNSNQEIEVVHFHSAEELIKAPFDYSVLFLDIMLDNGFDGVAIGVQLRERNNHALFIIITSRADRSEDAYEATTFRFFVKPISQAKVDKVMKAALEYMLYNSEQHIKMTYRHIDYILNIKDIVLIESYMRQRHIITVDSKYATNERWETLLEKMNKCPCFTRIGKSYYVNMHYIRSVSANAITFANGKVVGINSHSQEKFNDEYNIFLSDQGG